MAHPPDIDSNLTLSDFLNKTVGSTKGIKLDFKTITVVQPSFQMLKSKLSGKVFNNPIWLNADILPGPCYDKVCIPVDHIQFPALCKHYFPEATLSISWTTGSDMTRQENYFSWSQVISMGKLASQIIQPITFPMRAVLLQRSATQIDCLLNLSHAFTITVWSSSRDKVEVKDLVVLWQRLSDHSRIYYDLPSEQDKAFKEALKMTGTSFDKDGEKSFAWQARAQTQCEDVLVGYNSVMFSGDGGEVLSEKTLYAVYAKYVLYIDGVCTFINTEGLDGKKSITISINVASTTGVLTDMNSDRFVSLVLYNDGIFQLSVSGGEKKEGSVKSENGVFKFQIEEGSFNGKQRFFKCQITAQGSKGVKVSVSLTVESEPMADHLKIEVGKQPGAVLVEKVAFKATAGARSVNEGYQTIVFILCTIFLSFCYIIIM